MSEDMPPMTGGETKFVFDKSTESKKVEEVKPSKRSTSKIHIRKEGRTHDESKKFKCEGLDPDCNFSSEYKSAYANHIKTHKPDMLELYGGDIVQVWQPFGGGGLIWDTEKTIYVSPNQIKIPDGFVLHKLTGKIISKSIPNRTLDGAIRSMDFMEVIIKRKELDNK